MSSTALTKISIDALPHIAEGKVRDLYEVDANTLLFVASDRISAYDVIMGNGIPNKGSLLTLLSVHWFELLPTLVPSLRTHFQTLALPSAIPASLHPVLTNRSMVVRKLKIFPIEAIVRGYITGSAWREYQKTQTVHGLAMPSSLLNSSKFPQGAIYTPSTKAEAGSNDENISPSAAAAIVGSAYASRIEALALSLYNAAHAYALSRGIIIADTKFEFGLDTETDEIVLVDEVLTPDSSRFWPADLYEEGKEQESYDKEFLRQWLVKTGNKGKEGVSMPQEIADETAAKYAEAFEKLTGKKWVDALASGA